MIHHFRIALRMLGKRAGLSAGRLLTVTIVVTGVSAVFAVANATFLRPLPFPHADRLLRIYLQPPGTTGLASANPLTPVQFERFRERTTLLERLEGIWPSERAIAGDGEPEAVPAGRVSAGFFRMLGGEPSLGRVFTEDEVASDAKLAVIGHGMWMRRYGGDTAVIGRTILIDREPYTILGVMPSGFEPALAPSEFWTPLSTRNPMARTQLSSVQTMGLRRTNVSREQVGAEIEGIFEGLRREMPPILKGWTSGVIDLREAQFGSRRPAVLMLLAAVAALGFIAIANLANLTLADVLFRRGDFAIRAALGASRGTLAATEIVQSLILAVAGGAVGLAGAAWLVPVLLALDPSSATLARFAPIDWRVAVCGFGVAAFVMLAAVAVPVLRIAGPALAFDLTAGARRAVGSRGAGRVRIALVTTQTALALMLLSSGSLIVDALHRSSRVHPGFDPSRVVTAQIQLSANVFPQPVDRAVFVDHVLERLRGTPGVVDAASPLETKSLGEIPDL